jgi:integrase
MKGTVNKRPTRGGRAHWEYCFDLGKDPATGKRRRLTKSGFDTKRDAEDAMAKALADYRERPPETEDKPLPTFTEFFARWHKDKEIALRESGDKTAERYEELGQYAIRLYGATPLDRLITPQLQADQTRMLEHGERATKQHPEGRPLAPKTVRHVSFLVQACLDQAVEWDIISKNPMRKVKKPRVPKRRPKVVDREGFDQLLKTVAGTSLDPVVVVYAATGMRRGEECVLEWTDLDWDRGLLEISKSLSETKKGLRVKSTKSGESRRISIPAHVLDVLREHKRNQDEHRAIFGPGHHDLNLIFARPDGYYYSPDKLGTRIKAAMRKAGLQGVSLHSLRHTHASELLSKGAPITAVSERLGHASPNITLGIYSHALPSDNEVAAKLWNDAMAEVFEARRKEVLARKRGLTANDSTGSEKIRVIPIKSAS